MRLDQLVTSAAFTTLGGWLMASDDAHVTEDVRATLAHQANKRSSRAIQLNFDHGGRTREIWFWSKVMQRLGCRVCMGLEWSIVAWWATSDRRSRISPLRALVEIGAINGLHLVVAKLTTKEGQ